MSDAADPGSIRDEPEEWTVHDVERVWQGDAPFSVRRDTISNPARPDVRFSRLVLDHPGAVVILAVDEQERALVLQQYRQPALLRFVELPAGLLDVEDEDPLVAAQRELREEGLVVAEHWTHLFATYSSPGVSSERVTYFLARGLSEAPDRGGFEPEHEEADMTTSWVPVADLVEGIRDGPDHRRADRAGAARLPALRRSKRWLKRVSPSRGRCALWTGSPRRLILRARPCRGAWSCGGPAEREAPRLLVRALCAALDSTAVVPTT